MQEVMNQIYLNHRQGLVYQRRHFLQKPQKSERMRNSLSKQDKNNGLARYYGRSLDLSQANPQKEQKSKILSQKKYQLLPKKESQVVRKYVQSNTEKDIKFPKIKNNSDIKSNSTKVEENSQMTANSFFSSKRNFVIRRQKTTKTQTKKFSKLKNKKLKKYVQAVLFIIRLKKKTLASATRWEKTQRLSENLLKMIDKQVNKYYTDILRQPLLTLERILNKKLNDKSYNPSEHIVLNILEFSEILRESSIRRDILEFLTYLSLPNAYVPNDYFCQFELLRLDFHSKTQQIGKVTNEQIKMIVGIFMGVKLMATYIFYAPWNVKIFDLEIKNNQTKLRPLIWAYGSYFYWTILELFSDIEPKSQKYLEMLLIRGWEPMFVEDVSDEYFQQLKAGHKKKHQAIKRNLKNWIERITLTVIKNRQTSYLL